MRVALVLGTAPGLVGRRRRQMMNWSVTMLVYRFSSTLGVEVGHGTWDYVIGVREGRGYGETAERIVV